jgi:hypothetical protein
MVLLYNIKDSEYIAEVIVNRYKDNSNAYYLHEEVEKKRKAQRGFCQDWTGYQYPY